MSAATSTTSDAVPPLPAGVIDAVGPTPSTAVPAVRSDEAGDEMSQLTLLDASPVKDGESAAPSIISVIRARAEVALLDVVRDPYCSRAIWTFLQLFGLVQILLLALPASAPWRVNGAGASLVVRFQSFLLPVAFSPWQDPLQIISSRAVVTPFILASTFVITGGSLIILAIFRANVRSLAAGFRSAANRSDIVALRWVTRVGIIALPVPIFATLLFPLACGDVPWAAGLSCWSAVHSTVSIVGIFLAVCCLLWLSLATLVVHLRTIDVKVNPLGVSHGRVELMSLLVKIVLTAVYVLAPSSASPIALALVNVAGGTAFVAMYVYYLPYYDQTLNRVLAAFYSVFLVSACAQLLAVTLAFSGDAASASTSAGLVWIFCLPLGFYSGWSLAESRWRAMSMSKEISSPYVIELRARSVIAHSVRSLDHADMDTLSSHAAENGLSMNRVSYDEKSTAGSSKKGSASCPVVGVVGEAGSAWKNRFSKNSHHALAEDACRMHAERILKEGSDIFPTSAIMSVFLGAFMHQPRSNVHLERLQLHAAGERAEWFEIDVASVIAQRTVLLEEEEHAANSGKMTVKLRMHFEALQAKADKHVSDARTHILSFWTMLMERHPDLSALVTKGTEIFEATRAAEADYKELLIMAPLSVPTLRKYAVFLIEVVSNPGVGEELLADAEQLEDEVARSSADSVDDVVFGASLEFDLTVDGIALVTVSSSGPNLGIITDANVAALNLFGFTQNRRELLLRNVNTIIPEPFSLVHDMFLTDFAMHGTLRISGRSTVLFGQHREGHIFPMHVHVSASSGQWTAALEEIKAASMGFLLFMGRKSGFRVTAACRRSLRTFGFSAARLLGAVVMLTSYVEDPDALISRLLSHPGSIVGFINTASTEKMVYVSARLQEISVPHVDDSLFILRYREASAAEVDVSIATNLIAPRTSAATTNVERVLRSSKSEDAGDDDSDVGSNETAESDSDHERIGDRVKDALGSSRYSKNSDDESNSAEESGSTDENDGAADENSGAGQVPAKLEKDKSAIRGTVRQRRRGREIAAAGSSDAARVPSASKGDAKSLQAKSRRSNRDKKSVSSSDTSATTTMLSTAEMIRRGVYSRAVTMEVSLRRLQSFIIALFVFIFGVNIARHSTTTSAFASVEGSLDVIVRASGRLEAVQEILTEVQAQLLRASTPRMYALPKGATWSNERLRVRSNELEELHRSLFITAESSGGELLSSYVRRFVTTSSLHPGEWSDMVAWNATTRNSTFASTILEFVSTAREFWFLNASASFSSPAAFWLVQNGRETIVSELGSNVKVSGAGSASNLVSATLLNIAFTGFVLVTFIATMFLVILPGLSLVLTERREVFDVFTKVPFSIVAAMRRHVAQNIVSFKSSFEADGAADAGVFNSRESQAHDTGSYARVLSDTVLATAHNEEEHIVRRTLRKSKKAVTGCCSRASVEPAASKTPTAAVYRTFRNNYSGRARIFLALLAPVFIFCAYYVALFVTQKDVIDKAVDGRSRLLLAAELRSLVQSVALHTRFAVSSNSSRFVAQELDYAERDAALLATKIDVFAYGDSTAGIPSALATSEAAHRLLLVNGCVQNVVDSLRCANYGGQPCVLYYEMALCVKAPNSVDTGAPIFDYGVVGTGLLPAVRKYLTDVGDMLRVRRNQLSTLPFTTGASLDSGTGATVDAMGAAYLPAGFGALIAEMNSEISTYMRVFTSWNLATIASSSIALALVCEAPMVRRQPALPPPDTPFLPQNPPIDIFVYMPILQNLDEEIKRTRFLLLLFPEDVARRVPAVGDAAKRLLQGNGVPQQGKA